VNDKGVIATQHYQRWPGRGQRTRASWTAIVHTGLRLANQDAQARTMLYMSLAFVVGNCALLYTISMVETLAGQPQAKGMYNAIQTMLGVDLSAASRIGELREVLWRCVFLFIIKFQLFWVMTTVARVGPGQIADDLKARALPIYFSKPITPVVYLLGKWLVVATFVGLVVLVPNLLSLFFGVLITGGLHTWGQTLLLAADVTVAGVGIMVIAGMLVLALSSLSADKRYVSVGWFAVCIVPVIAQQIIRENAPERLLTGAAGSISLYGDVMVLVERLFNIRSAFAASNLPTAAFQEALLSPVKPIYPALVLGSVVLLSVIVCSRRVIRFSRSAASL